MRTLTTLVCLAALGTASYAQLGPSSTIAVGANPEGIVVTQLTGDTALDLAVAVDGPDRVSIRPGNGDGTFGAEIPVFTGAGTSPHTPVAGDFDGDGDNDMAVTLKNVGLVRILTNQGGTFVNGGSIAAGLEPRRLVAGQLTADTRPDLVAVDRDNSTVSVLINDGSGGFSSTTFAVGTEPRDAAIADVDGDLDGDLIVSAHDVNRLELYLNNGSGTLSAGPTLSLGQLRPEGVAGRDVDDDGDIDIVVAASGGGLNVIAIFTNNGGFGGFATRPVSAADPSFLLMTDLDADGDDDAVTVNNDGNSISQMLNDGSGLFGVATVLGSGGNPGQAGAGDVDGSGTPDVFVSNQDAGTLTMFLNQLSASAFADLGGALSGTTSPAHEGIGSLVAGTPFTWSLTNALPNGTTAFVLGLSVLNAPFKGGTMVPALDIIILGLPIDGTGALSIPAIAPALPSGVQLVTQFWISDPGGPVGFSASNGIVGTVP